ncbi:MAG TPA: hypothetical protein VKM55_18550 [Candidatus Lokiarchaeia archaeon]|nr:hypothetical protein [Candidatus Lokiarchaeia archaeon]
MAILKIKSLLMSRRFSIPLFIAVAFLHLLLYWLLGILVVVINRAVLPTQYAVQFAEDLSWDFSYAQTFLTKPLTLYSYNAQYVSNLQYLPAFMLYDVPWYLACSSLGPISFGSSAIYQSMIVYNFSMVVWNLVNCFLIYKIMNTNKVQAMLGNTVLRNPFILMSLYMGTSVFYIDYFVGQDNAVLGFFLLLGIFCYVNDKEHFTYFFWGIGLWFKTILVIFIVVLILHGPLKRFVKNAAFLALSQVPNAILFVVYPSLLTDFFYNVVFRLGSPYILSIPVNMVQFLYQYYNVAISTSYIIIFCSLLPLTAYVFAECKKAMTFFDKMMVLSLLFLNIVQGEPNHVIIMLGVYLVWIAIKNKDLHDSIRYLKLMLGIPFIGGLLWLIFPYNPLIYFSALIWLNLAFIFPTKLPLNKIGTLET